MAPRTRPKKDPEELREEALRPCSVLGYNWDALGLYFLEREAFALAEPQFRRAIWLNPYDPKFKVHLAHALLRLDRSEEAKSLLADVLVEHADSMAATLWERHWPDERPSDQL